MEGELIMPPTQEGQANPVTHDRRPSSNSLPETDGVGCLTPSLGALQGRLASATCAAFAV